MINNKSLLFISASALLHIVVAAALYNHTTNESTHEQGGSSLSIVIDNEITDEQDSTLNKTARIDKTKQDRKPLQTATKAIDPKINHAVEKKSITIDSRNKQSISDQEPLAAISEKTTSTDLLNGSSKPLPDQAQIDSIIRQEFSKYFYYPKSAQRKNWQGLVILRFIIEEDGIINSISISKSSGYSVLDNAAITALKRIDKKNALSIVLNGLQYSQLLPVQYKLNFE